MDFSSILKEIVDASEVKKDIAYTFTAEGDTEKWHWTGLHYD